MAITFVDENAASATAQTIDLGKAGFVGLADGDLVLVFLHCDVDLAFSAPPTGFTMGDELITTAGRDCTSAYFYKYITNLAGEPTVWTFTQPSTSEKALTAGAFRGVDSASPIHLATTGYEGTSGNTPDAPNITTTVDGAMIVTMCGLSDSGTGLGLVGVAPSGYTLIEEIERVTNDTALCACAYDLQTSAGEAVIGDWQNTGDPADTFHVRTLALEPAGAPPTSTPYYYHGLIGNR